MSLALIAVANSADAGTITISSLTDNETDIVNLATTVVSAANIGGITVDINGISHPAASAAATGNWADLIPELTINSTFDGFYRSGSGGYTGDMNTLMGGIAGTGSPGPITLDISGLTIGKQYLFQGYWEAVGLGQTASITFEGTDTQGGISGGGSLISYTFTAGDTNLDADLTKTGGSDNIWWQGYSVQEVVPEPTTTALLGLGGLALILRRRK